MLRCKTHLSSREFNNKAIEILREFLQTKTLPNWKEESKIKYRENYKHFILGENNKIFYEPLHLEVIEDENKENIMIKTQV